MTAAEGAPAPRRTLGTQLALVTLAVAATAVLITGLVSAGLVRGAADTEARRLLSVQADLAVRTTDSASTTTTGANRLRVGVANFLRREKVSAVRVDAAGTTTAVVGTLPLDAADARAIAAGNDVHAVRRIDGGRVFVEGRAPPEGGGIALLQRASEAPRTWGTLLRRIALALLAGLAVAGVAGVLLARRLARPLQRAAVAAHELAGGRRDLRLEPRGPAEVAEVSDALNSLAGALQTSEGRQREFLLSVSHELRTPLTAIQGFAEALADGVTPPGETAATGEIMLAEAHRLDRLVADLLDLARLGADDFRLDVVSVDLTALVAAAAQVWSARCNAEGVPLHAELPPGPVVVPTDGVRVRQILDGLAENALRVVPAGRPIVLALATDGTDAVLAVRDGGPGLTEADRAVAFERSALYDRYRGVRRVGTGVGLALVAGLAARLGGTAVAGRSPEGGAAFTVRLPSAGPPH